MSSPTSHDVYRWSIYSLRRLVECYVFMSGVLFLNRLGFQLSRQQLFVTIYSYLIKNGNTDVYEEESSLFFVVKNKSSLRTYDWPIWPPVTRNLVWRHTKRKRIQVVDKTTYTFTYVGLKSPHRLVKGECVNCTVLYAPDLHSETLVLDCQSIVICQFVIQTPLLCFRT